MPRTVLVVAEHRNGALRKSARELISAARGLGEVDIKAVALGPGSESAAAALSGHGVDAFHVEAPQLDPAGAEAYTSAVTDAAGQFAADAILMAATRLGLSVTPRVAVRLDAPLLEDVIALEHHDGQVVARRFSYLSRVTETVRADATPVVVSVKPNVFPEAESGASGSVAPLEVAFRPSDVRVTVGERAAASGGRVALEEAAVVVTGGRGMGSSENFEQLVLPLAAALGAGVGSTRAVVDAGWRPYAEQIGQTGKTVAPELYIALGVSGAVQHLSGMNRSKVIVAVNKNEDEPIFKVADYGIVGDVTEVVPALTAAVAALED